MIYNVIIDILFRLINLGVLVAVGAYLYKKYILTTIENTIAEEESYHNGLRQQLGALESRVDDISHEKITLEKSGLLLKNKVDLWREQQDKAQLTRDVEKQALTKRAIMRVEKQSLNIAQEELLSKASAQALERARTTLQRTSSAEQSHEYIKTLIIKMQREIHGK